MTAERLVSAVFLIERMNHMIKLGTIGTSWITEQYIEAAQNSGKWELTYVQSRNINKAQTIVDKFGSGTAIDSVEEMVEKSDLTAIYIASPNSLHFEHAKLAVLNKKHAIVEKPSFSNLAEWDEINALAKENGVYVIEAARHIQTKTYKHLKSLIDYKQNAKQYPFLGANLNIGQYSSKYDQYQQGLKEDGSIPNVFNPDFAGGSLYDIGIYPLYVAVDLFGKPQKSMMNVVKGANDIDLFNHAILEYDGFNISIFNSKAVHSVLHSEFYFDNELIKVNNITDIDTIEVISKSDSKVLDLSYPVENPMDDEVVAFAEMINENNDAAYNDLTTLSRDVLEVITELKEEQ